MDGSGWGADTGCARTGQHSTESEIQPGRYESTLATYRRLVERRKRGSLCCRKRRSRDISMRSTHDSSSTWRTRSARRTGTCCWAFRSHDRHRAPFQRPGDARRLVRPELQQAAPVRWRVRTGGVRLDRPRAAHPRCRISHPGPENPEPLAVAAASSLPTSATKMPSRGDHPPVAAGQPARQREQRRLVRRPRSRRNSICRSPDALA